MKKLSLLLVIICLLIPSVGCYAHGPWKGKVIESDTKKPIQGAVVVAVWYSLTRLNPAGSSPDTLKVIETETNADGEFEFSSKYFISVPMFREVSGPDFLVYKPGYNVFQISYVSEEHPLYKKGFAIIELPRLEKREDRLKAWEWAGGFRSFTNAYAGKKTYTPKLDELLQIEETYLYRK